MEIKFNEKEYYEKYIGEITCAYKSDIFVDAQGKERCGAKRSAEREKYLFKGLTDDVVLIECPADMLVIEFETHDVKGINHVTKERLKEFVRDTAKNCEKHKIDYCVCSHGGTSDYIYVCNIEGLIENKEKDCKQEMAKKIIPKEAIDFLDLSNLGKTLIPVINRPHWKTKKYNGAIHRIISGKAPDKHKNKTPDVVLQKLVYETRPQVKKLNYEHEDDINSISITDVISTTGLKKRGNEYQGSNVWHGSATGMNFTVNPNKNVWHCFRCGVGGSVAQAIALNHGLISSCDDKISSEQFKQVLKIAQDNYGLRIRIKEIEKPKEIKREETDYAELQREVLIAISLKDFKDASEMIVNAFLNKNYVYTTRDDIKSEMWIYRDGIYIPQGKSFVKEFCRMILGRAYNQFMANLVIAKIETDTAIDQEEFFENDFPELLPVQNGVLNVKTRELSPFDPKKIFFNKLPVKYDKNAVCPSIDKFLKDILSTEEDILVAYELIGAGLYKEYLIEKAGMLIGFGRNAKTTFINLIKRLAGIENCSSVPIRAMKEDNSSLCELHGKLFNLAGDLSGGDLRDTGVFKETVGRDTIQAHRKFLRDLIFVNYAQHIFGANELPRVFDFTDGFWDKWVLLEFPYKFITQEEINRLPEEERKNKKIKDPEIIDKISEPEELSGLLNMALDGLDRLFKNKNYSQTKGTKEIKELWIRKSDSFTAFCMDNIEEDYQGWITKKALRTRFSSYCKKHKIKGAGDKDIKAILEDRYGCVSDRKTIEGDVVWVWEGIKFKTNYSGKL